MADPDPAMLVTSLEQLEALYGQPSAPSLVKEMDRVHPHYQRMIEISPFVVLATCGPEGLDCSPRGDAPGFVRVENEKTLLIPDRRGNNRIDTLRNLVRDPRLSLLFLIPGIGETLRVNGRGSISTDAGLAARFVVNGQSPRTVLIVNVEAVYFQCSKALVRSRLWDPQRQLPRTALPSTGTMLDDFSAGGIAGDAYDQAYPQRLKETLY